MKTEAAPQVYESYEHPSGAQVDITKKMSHYGANIDGEEAVSPSLKTVQDAKNAVDNIIAVPQPQAASVLAKILGRPVMPTLSKILKTK